MARVAAAISRSGDVMPRVSAWTMSRDRLPAARPDRMGDTPARTPKSTTTTVTHTAATMTAPSFHLMDGRPSSGRRREGFTTASASRAAVGPGDAFLVAGGIADAVDGADHRRPQLAPQGLHVGVDGAGPEAVPVAPDVGQHLLPGEDHAGLVAEEGEDVELGGGEVDGLPVEGRPAGGRLEGHPAEAQRPPGRVGGRLGLGRAVDPAEDGVDPGH